MDTNIMVRNVLEKKGSTTVWWIGPHATVYEALEIMSEKDIGALLVLENGRLVGIFSERDYARKVILYGRSSKTTTVGDLMTSPVITIGPDDSITNCMQIMVSNHIRHIPVVENDRILGLITLGDVVKVIISAQEEVIRNLQSYISGDYIAAA